MYAYGISHYMGNTFKKITKISAVVLGVLILLVIIGLSTGVISLSGSSNRLKVTPVAASFEPQQQPPAESPTFAQAVELFAVEPPTTDRFSGDQQEFLAALAMVEAAKYGEAEQVFSKLSLCSDTLVRRFSRTALASTLRIQGKWAQLAVWVDTDPTLLRDSTVRKDDGALFECWSRYPSEKYLIPDKPVTLPMSTVLGGQAVVEVSINGHKKKFALDTGADMTVVSSDIVDECSVKVSDSVTSRVATSTSKTVGSSSGLIEELRIGDLLINNHPVLVIPAEDLEFSLLGFKIVHVDGIIGLPVFMNLEVTMDFVSKQITFARPPSESISPSNVFYMEMPIVRLSDKSGKPVYFDLDTGSRKGGITRKLVEYLSLKNAKTVEGTKSGAGGFENYSALQLDTLQLYFNNYLLTFEDVTSLADEAPSLIQRHGRLGINVAADGILRIDFANGRLDLTLPQQSNI